jgi:hypothetical protein
MLHVTTEEKIEDYKGVIRSRKGQQIQWSKHKNNKFLCCSTKIASSSFVVAQK